MNLFKWSSNSFIGLAQVFKNASGTEGSDFYRSNRYSFYKFFFGNSGPVGEVGANVPRMK